MIQTAECVSAWHPDKICDQIADVIVDECLKQDENSRCAIEVLGGHDQIFVSGEVTTKAKINYSQIVKEFYKNHCLKPIGVIVNLVEQSPDIAKGVDKGGAGDQGVMVGYACNDNEAKIPQEMFIARMLLEAFTTDAKSQVTVENGKVTKVVLAVQGAEAEDLKKYAVKVIELLTKGDKPKIYCNNTGAFTVGGFDADCGVTGRKIVVDAYGPRVPVGGGAFSGKDPTKVDRSGAYMARWIALDLLDKRKAKEVLVKIAYVIGAKEPVMTTATIDGKFEDITGKYDCSPKAIIKKFKLNKQKNLYEATARFGAFGLKKFPWEIL